MKNPTLKSLLVISTISVCLPAFAAANCDSAEREIQDSLENGYAGEELKLVVINASRSYQCESDFIQKNLGRAFLQSGATKKAIRTLKQAYRSEVPDYETGILLIESLWQRANSIDDLEVKNRLVAEALDTAGILTELPGREDTPHNDRFEVLLSSLDGYMSDNLGSGVFGRSLVNIGKSKSAGAVTAALSVQVSFETNSANLDQRGEQQLLDILGPLSNFVQTNDQVRFKIKGHADVRGEETYNQTLSEKRAAKVKDWFVEQNPSLEDHLVAIGYGESQPRYHQVSELAHQGNRRVEFDIE